MNAMTDSLAIEDLRPFGVVARPTADSGINRLDQLLPATITDLVAAHKLVVLRGFDQVGEHDLMRLARRFGPLLRWEFGEVLNLKVVERPPNHLFHTGRVEMHWDGAYLTEVPPLSLFQCINASQTSPGGETLFTHTPRVVDRLNEAELVAWSDAAIRYATERAAHYCGDVTVPLLGKHPRTGESVVRFIEPYNEDNADINPVEVQVVGLPEARQEPFLRRVIDHIYDPAVMYRHTWRTGDFLIYDNLALLHGRARLEGNANRHLQRVHILERNGSLESRPPEFIGARKMDVHV
jgi:alpha-ketoglutarate-dependent taurine dioxygenase